MVEPDVEELRDGAARSAAGGADPRPTDARCASTQHEIAAVLPESPTHPAVLRRHDRAAAPKLAAVHGFECPDFDFFLDRCLSDAGEAGEVPDLVVFIVLVVFVVFTVVDLVFAGACTTGGT